MTWRHIGGIQDEVREREDQGERRGPSSPALPRAMSEGATVRFDVSAIVDRETRASITKELERRNWVQVQPASGYGPIVFVGHANGLVTKSEFLRSRLHNPTGVVALVESEDDRDALTELEVYLCDPKLTVGFEFGLPHVLRSRLLDRIDSIAQRLAPDRVHSAQLVDGGLVVSFGDGFAHLFDWRRTKALSRLRGVPKHAAVSEDFDSVVVRMESGKELDIDGRFLRGLVDASAVAESERDLHDIQKRIGTRLRAFREKARLSQEDLEKRSGLPQESISRLENGTRSPRLPTLMKLAKGLDVPLDRLLRAIGDDEQKET